MSLRRFLLSCSAVLLALSVVVRDADALDTVQPTYLSKQTCGFDVCQNQGPIQWGDWNYGEAFRYQFFEGLQLTLSVWRQATYDGPSVLEFKDNNGNVVLSDSSIPKLHYHYWRWGAYVANVFGEWAEIVVRYEENYTEQFERSYLFRFLAKKDGTSVLRLSNDDFLSLRNGNVRLVKYNSSTSNLDYYSLFHDGSGNYSFAFDSDQSAPAVFSPAASIPVFSDVSTFSPGTVQPTFQYSGTDGGSYVLVPYAIGGPRTYRLDTGETSWNSFWDSVKDFFGFSTTVGSFPALSGKVPVASFEPADDRLITFWQSSYLDPTGMGWWFPGISWGRETLTGAIQSPGVTIDGVFPWEFSQILGISGFSNPKLYFLRQNGTYAVWDTNCQTVGFDSCVQSSPDVWKCADSLGNLSPNGEVCWVPLVSQPYVSGGSSSSGSTSWGSSSGTWSTGSGSTGSGSTGSGGSVSVGGQSCVSRTFAGTSAPDPSTCAWRWTETSLLCMTSQGYSCSVSGDSCLPSVDDPAAPKDSPDSIRYDCSDGVTSCTWSSADSCGPSGSCVADRSYCVVKDPVVSPSPQPSPTVSGALDTIASKFFDQKAPGILDSKAPGSSGFSSSVSGSGTGYAPVPSGLPDSGLTRSCRMFDDSGFVYHWSGALRISFTSMVPEQLPLVTYVTRPVDWILSPVNNVLSVLQTFYLPRDGSEICFFGRVYVLNYQGLFRGKTPIPGFQSTDLPKDLLIGSVPVSAYVGHFTVFDYLFLFLSGVGLLFASYVLMFRESNPN